ncbi:glycosyl transferase, family I [Desulfosarcina variabilis str. Montpellier]
MASDLAKILNQCKGITAHHWMGYRGNEWEPYMRFLYGGKAFHSFQFVCRMFSQLLGFPDFFTPEIFYLWKKKEIDYNIYHFHDISRTFSPIALRWLAKRRPVAWTFRDCSPITGGCLYPMECNAFRSRCRKCPQLRVWPLQTFLDATGIMQDYKRETAKLGILTPVVASQWMAKQVMESGMFLSSPCIIPNYVDLDIFHPMPKTEVRKKLGFNIGSFIIMMSAPKLDDKRKGAFFALNALKNLNRKFEVIITGKISSSKLRKQFEGIPIHEVGYIRDRFLLAQYYSASDIFLFPSLAETFCNSVLEAMACGTPPVAFQVGAIPELITHGFHGWLASSKNIDELVKGMQILFDQPDIRNAWAKNAQKKSLEYHRNEFINSHISLYNNILKYQMK